jgi:DMSO/TMAO reductase YedYZ molybdopterin-dependent catalytic subunit
MAAGGLLLGQDRMKRDMHVLSARPEDLEMQLSGFSDYITPFEHFFVRTHVYVPAVDIGEWRLNVAGEVAKPLTLTMEDIRKLPAVEMVAVVECAGNGRGLYQPTVPGLQWTNGSVGNARWRGVRLADVLKQAGIKHTGIEVLFDGADQPIGKMQDFRRTITVKKALDPNTLLAYEMNGEPIPVKHGFPLRVIPAGWASDSWVKWLTTITVLDKEFDGFWMKNAYRKPDHPVAPMTALTPDQMKPVTSLLVKSVIASPLDNAAVKVGTALTIRGVAWSGDSGPVTAVDVSTDSGRSWKPASLARGQETKFGWRQWEYAWTPEHDAYYTIMARARDSAGNTQPFAEGWNPSGYGWNVVQKVGVAAGVPPAASSPAVSFQPESAEFKRTCEVCHGTDVITQQHLTRGQWDREITKMTNWGAQVKPEDRNAFLDYLFANFGQRP